jgi:hypothetical protein
MGWSQTSMPTERIRTSARRTDSISSSWRSCCSGVRALASKSSAFCCRGVAAGGCCARLRTFVMVERASLVAGRVGCAYASGAVERGRDGVFWRRGWADAEAAGDRDQMRDERAVERRGDAKACARTARRAELDAEADAEAIKQTATDVREDVGDVASLGARKFATLRRGARCPAPIPDPRHVARAGRMRKRPLAAGRARPVAC